jgi:hypothetical protein
LFYDFNIKKGLTTFLFNFYYSEYRTPLDNCLVLIAKTKTPQAAAGRGRAGEAAFGAGRMVTAPPSS